MADQPDLDEVLAAVPIFAGLTRRQRAKLLEQSRVVSREAGREVTAEGSGALAMHLVLEGSADVTIRGQHVRALGPGEYFGEISVIDGKPRSATVTPTTAMSTLVVPRQAFEKLIEDDPSAARAVLVGLCSRLREAESS